VGSVKQLESVGLDLLQVKRHSNLVRQFITKYCKVFFIYAAHIFIAFVPRLNYKYTSQLMRDVC